MFFRFSYILQKSFGNYSRWEKTLWVYTCRFESLKRVIQVMFMVIIIAELGVRRDVVNILFSNQINNEF